MKTLKLLLLSLLIIASTSSCVKYVVKVRNPLKGYDQFYIELKESKFPEIFDDRYSKERKDSIVEERLLEELESIGTKELKTLETYFGFPTNNQNEILVHLTKEEYEVQKKSGLIICMKKYEYVANLKCLDV